MQDNRNPLILKNGYVQIQIEKKYINGDYYVTLGHNYDSDPIVEKYWFFSNIGYTPSVFF